MTLEQDSFSGSGTMNGLENSPVTPAMEERGRLERSVPPPRHGEQQDELNLPPTNWANHELPKGSPDAPGIQKLIERDKRYAEEGPPPRSV